MWNDGKRDWERLPSEGLFWGQVPGRGEVQEQAHDAKVVWGRMPGIPAYLLAYPCLLITVTVTYERAWRVAYV